MALRSRVFSPSLGLLAAVLLAGPVALVPSGAARANVTITGTTVAGPVSGNGGTFTVTTTGTITSAGAGIVATSTTAITTLTVNGVVGPVFSNAIQNNAGSSITSIGISGTVTGGSAGPGLFNSGTVGSLTTNAGGRLASTGGAAMQNSGRFTGTISNAGTFAGVTYGLNNEAAGQILAFTNSGVVQASTAVLTTGTITTLTNQAGGWLKGDDNGSGISVEAGSVGTLVNSGSTTGYNGLSANAAITTLTNSGALAGSNLGVRFQGSAAIGSFTNSGLVSGLGDWGIIADAGSTLGTLSNTASGTISGGANGLGIVASTGTISNAGLLQGGQNALRMGGASSVVLLSNSGTATGGSRGFWIEAGTLTTAENSGRIAGNNAVENYGTITSFTNSGVLDGVGTWGFYTESTASLGTLTNSGTIQGTGYGLGLIGASGTISNLAGGRIAGTNDDGVYVTGAVTSLSNAGMIAGGTGSGDSGVQIETPSGTLSTLTNTGTITGLNGIFTRASGVIGILANSGTVEGTSTGVFLQGLTSGTISNLAGGRIAGTADDGVNVQGALTSLANAGTIAGGTGTGDSGVEIVGAIATVSTLTNTGNISGLFGIQTALGGGFGTLTNSGTVQGASIGLRMAGNVSGGTISNLAGGLIAGTDDDGVLILRAVTSLSNAGTIAGGTGTGDSGVEIVGTTAMISTLTNTGNITGLFGISTGTSAGSDGRIGTLTNSGTVQGTYTGLRIFGAGSGGTISNLAGGLITGTDDDGIAILRAVTSLSNAGTIAGGTGSGDSGVEIASTGGIGTLTNTGNITGLFGISTENNGVISTLTNSGTVQGSSTGLRMAGTGSGGTISNLAGGLITGTDDGVAILRNVTSLSNAGTIAGGTSGVQVTNGLLQKLTNTGTIAYTGSGTGPAVLVGPGGVLGVASGTAGPAIESTGAGASLIGTIVNQGTVHYGFTIGNQNVTVSAGGGAGTFTDGMLDVVDGNLTFTSGTTTLAADISVNGGAGTVSNEGTLRLLGIETVTGNFQQTSGGTVLMGLLGTSSGQYGGLDMSGSASFAGGLALDDTGLAGGLADGQLYQLFGFGSYSGGFSSLAVNGTSLSSVGAGVWAYGSLLLTEQWTGTTMSLGVTSTAIPEIDPAGLASVLSLVVGALGLAERRVRRGRHGDRAAG